MREVAKKGTPITQAVTVKGGTIGSIRPVWAADATVFMKRDAQKQSYTINYALPATIVAPIKAGQSIGTGEVIVEGKPQQAIAVVAPADVAQGSLIQRLIGDL